jgi:hypothetical protein
MRLGVLISSLLALLSGVLLVWRPAMMLRWMLRAYPELADDNSVLLVVRGIGVVGIVMGARMLADL